jgi:hypothetical protein
LLFFGCWAAPAAVLYAQDSPTLILEEAQAELPYCN